MTDSTPRDLREEILKSAKNLFVRQGYHGMSMRQIAETVGVSKAALYYHFTDKEELLFAILFSYLDEMGELIEQIKLRDKNPREQIVRFVHLILSQPVEQRALIRLASQEVGQLSPISRKNFGRIYQEKFIGKIWEIFEEGIRIGELRRVDPMVATWSLLGMMYPYFYPTQTDEIGPSPEVVDELVGIFMEGVAASHPA